MIGFGMVVLAVLAMVAMVAMVMHMSGFAFGRSHAGLVKGGRPARQTDRQTDRRPALSI